MTAQERIAAAAAKIGALTGIVRVRREDAVRAENRANGGEARTEKELSEIVRRLEKSLS